jgi:hypothetical protein
MVKSRLEKFEKLNIDIRNILNDKKLIDNTK